MAGGRQARGLEPDSPSADDPRNSESAWRPIKAAGSLPDRIAERIEGLIERQALEAGERLPPERDMARMLGVSRPALREAVKTLAARGRLVVRHGQGVFVSLSATDAVRAELRQVEVSLAELFAMREVLEAPAAAWAATGASSDEVEELARMLLADQQARRQGTDFTLLAELDSAFHLRIVELAKNRFLARTVGILQEMMAEGMETTLTIPGRLEVSDDDHDQLLAAIRDHDPVAARAAIVRHIHGARDAALERIRRESATLETQNPFEQVPWNSSDNGDASVFGIKTASRDYSDG